MKSRLDNENNFFTENSPLCSLFWITCKKRPADAGQGSLQGCSFAAPGQRVGVAFIPEGKIGLHPLKGVWFCIRFHVPASPASSGAA